MTCLFRSPGFLSEPPTCNFAWRKDQPWQVCAAHKPQVLTCPVKIIAANALVAAVVVLEVVN